MDVQAHWQAIYDEARAALDGAGYNAVPIYHVTSTNDQTGEPAAPPHVVYRDETMGALGTTGDDLAVVQSNFLFTVRAYTLGEVLDYLSALVGGFEAAGIDMTTTDGYATTAITIVGHTSLYEPDSKLYAGHFRVNWQRSL